MALTAGRFLIALHSPIPMAQGLTAISGEGPAEVPSEGGWRMVIRAEAPPADPWPNTELGGHEFTGGVMEIWKGDEIKYQCSNNIEWHVWRDDKDCPRRIYAENILIPADPHDWEIGGPVPDYDNVALENGVWLYRCALHVAPGVLV